MAGSPGRTIPWRDLNRFDLIEVQHLDVVVWQADSDDANVFGLRALLALREVELDPLVLIEATEAAR